MVVRNVRPLAEAMEALGNQFHLPITYEDPPYLFPGDIEDITSRVMRPEAVAHLLATGQRLPVLMGMKERELKFGYAFPANSQSSDSQVRAAIQSALDAYNSGYPPGIFELRHAGGRFHVFPKMVKDKSGKYIPWTSLLDLPISVEVKERRADEFLQVLCFAVSRAGQNPFHFGNGVVSNGLIQQRTSLGGQNRPARELLLAFLTELESRDSDRSYKNSWAVLNDGSSRAFALNLYGVPTGATGEGNRGAGSAPSPVEKTDISKLHIPNSEELQSD